MSYYIAVSDKPSISFVNTSMIEERLDPKFYSNSNLSIIKRILDGGLLVKSLNELSKKITQGPNPRFIDDNRGIPCLKTRNIYDHEIIFEGCNYISESEYKNLERFKILYGDILIAIQGEGSIGKSNIYTKKEKAIFSRPIGLVRVKDNNIDPFYLSAFLRSFYGKKLLERGISGSSGQLVLAVEYIKTIPIALPNESIQKYIGNKVRKAEELREEAKRLKEEAEEILFNELRIKELEHLLMEQNKKYNWVEETALTERIDAYYYKAKYTILDKFISQFEYVITKKIADVEYGYMPQEDYTEVDSGIPIIRITNMPGNLLIDSSDIKHIPVNEKIKDRHFVRENDILMVQLGDTTGKVAYVSKEFDGYLFPSFCLKISLKDTNKVLPGYLALLYESKIMQLQIEQTISYASVRPNTTKPAIESLKIPIVEMSKQKEIADRILNYIKHIYESKHLIIEAKQDVEDLIEGKFDESKISEGV